MGQRQKPSLPARAHEGTEDGSGAVRVLVAEDDEALLDLITRILRDEGFAVTQARTGHEAMAAVKEGRFDVLVSDVRMPGPDGIELLRTAMATHMWQPVVLMTAFGSIESAVQAMRDGAFHYLAKPFDIDELLGVVGAAARQIVPARGRELPLDPAVAGGTHLVYRSQTMTETIRVLLEVAPSQATVLITGNSGTGKELLARAVHAHSPRASQPFVAVDCSAIAESLIESELFGHRRGAFTGAVADRPGIVEQANGGTLFLDEVGNLSLPVQAKLLRFLQERRFRPVGGVGERAVDVRLVCATNADLRERVAHGTFREDLYYRLQVIPLHVADLKDRAEDIAPLAYHFIRIFNRDGYRVEGLRHDALDLLESYPWPGNVRELENVMERAVILRKAGLIQPRDLPENLVGAAEAVATQSLDELERETILRALAQHDGNRTKVARLLGINRRTLYRKLLRYGVSDEPDE